MNRENLLKANIYTMVLILLNIFLWGAFIQLVLFRRKGFAYETIKERAPAAAAPAPLFSVAMIFTIILFLIIFTIYLPTINKLRKAVKNSE